MFKRPTMTPAEFKKRYPRVYSAILNKYSQHSRVFDHAAAITLAMNNIAPPKCCVCGQHLSVTKKFRNPIDIGGLKCKRHINTEHVVEKSQVLLLAQQKALTVIQELPDQMSRSTTLALNCPQHGVYQQTVGYFLDGGRCQKCYHESKGPRINQTQWITRSQQKHGERYDYSHSNFVSLTHDVTIGCPVHGVFQQNAGVHMRGHGCPQCARDRSSTAQQFSTDRFIELAREKHRDFYLYQKTQYQGARSRVTITCPVHGDFTQVAYYHLSGNGCPECGISTTTYKSRAEYEIIEFLSNQGITDIQHSSRHLGFELDIFIPSHNLAIEYNGVFWHSSGSRATDAIAAQQHLNKTQVCEQRGITLLHILDLEWCDPIKQKIWKSTILHKLGMSSEKIYARNCGLVMVSHKTSTDFFNQNHLQGAATSPLTIGLQYNGSLVAAGSFSKSRFRKDKSAYELIRFASKLGTSVVGGFQKIIKEFARTHQGQLISYANRRWSQGNVYHKSGFRLESTSDPCYYYTNCRTLWHRTVFQKHKLKDVLPVFDPSLTEIENMYNNKYRRIWDCGHLVFALDL